MSEYEAKQEARRTRLRERHQSEETRVCDALLRSGCYSLVIDLKRKKTVRVGKLGEAVFPAGTYVYTGSAMKGLGARLKRHCTKTKKTHWHIDHLLTLASARVRQIVLYPAASGQECRQNKRIAARPGAAVILKNFGASDCKSGCASHLFFFAEDFLPKFPEYHDKLFRPELELFRRSTKMRPAEAITLAKRYWTHWKKRTLR